jgi:hypothetical protein
MALGALAFISAAPAMAQPGYGGAVPPGPYQRQCSNIRMEGQFLHAYCRGAREAGESSINVQSCSTGIYVDDSGGLTCVGPGGGAPPAVRDAPPGYNTGQQTYDRGYQDRGYDRGRSRASAVLFERRGYRGEASRVAGPSPDVGLRVGSIQLDRRSGPWLVCSDRGFRGRCVTITSSVSDTRSLGLRGGVGSMRPTR